MQLNNWKWYLYTKDDIDQFEIEHQQNKSSRDWLNDNIQNKSNILEIEKNEQDQDVIKGSLVYEQQFNDQHDQKIFHFYLSQDQLITVNLDFSIFTHSSEELMEKHIRHAKTAVDGFLLIIRELLREYLCRIDEFEGELRELIWDIHEKNNTNILERIYKRRHELLVWNNLLIPIKELVMAIDEVYFDELESNKLFTRTQKRLKRTLYLINEYEAELDSIINLEEVVSSHRGNEIMKTLTVMTAIFTPIMAWGALWGMNFKFMPELEWKYGYLMSIIIIIVSMIAIYMYLKMKGWMGDLLKSKKKGTFFK
ncbi:Mg2+ transporter protein, CorA-like protein [Metabacillus sediminilitoris]|uniref:Mg2+ transporter protein, CorA-like protein n=1 Tax=Metabacillus sediminilitoris TaxID=2567941 RepID=A0A4S4C441_9BACI|nr:Mg2+ transporter protein, CorA-like protein [Metabacillus sediminilitoris]THF82531.1 Mg2+ transporter protein, CorA-like protein [Metabacillus sediminilitoris]